MDRQIEKSILCKSHDEQESQQLLNNRYSLGGDQKPLLNLNNTNVPATRIKQQAPDRFKSQRRIARHSLNNYIKQAKRAQNLAKQGKDAGRAAPKYDSFLQLNELWNAYLTDLLTHNHGTTATGKLASADYHGASLTVTQARNPTLVGINGICIWEARSAFVVCTPHDEIKMLQKQGAKFKLHAKSLPHDYEIIGSRFVFRTAERSGRKFKPKPVDDL